MACLVKFGNIFSNQGLAQVMNLSGKNEGRNKLFQTNRQFQKEKADLHEMATLYLRDLLIRKKLWFTVSLYMAIYSTTVSLYAVPLLHYIQYHCFTIYTVPVSLYTLLQFHCIHITVLVFHYMQYLFHCIHITVLVFHYMQYLCFTVYSTTVSLYIVPQFHCIQYHCFSVYSTSSLYAVPQFHCIQYH